LDGFAEETWQNLNMILVRGAQGRRAAARTGRKPAI
jgi:hypothetical protein